MDKQAAIYIRVSTLDQAREGYSLSAQEKALRAWCSVHNYNVFSVYADEGISGKDISHRPAMLRMLADADDRKVDVIIVWALSRLTRSVADLYNTWERITSHNVGLVSYTESFDTSTPTGRAMMGLLGVFAQMEREITAERVKAAMAERAAQGKRTTNDVLGYNLAGSDNLEINPEEAQRIQYIFDKFEACHSYTRVAELCKAHGIYGKRGKIFKPQNIKTILTRPVYVGYNTFNDKIYKGNYKPIISPEQYHRVQMLTMRH